VKIVFQLRFESVAFSPRQALIKLFCGSAGTMATQARKHAESFRLIHAIKSRMAPGSALMASECDLDIGSGHPGFDPMVQIHFLRTSHTFTS
jgi:hypothetical protein